MSMRRSSASGGRPSLALRVKNVNESKSNERLSSGSSFGSRHSIGGRLSLTGGKRGIPRPSVGLGGGLNKVSRRTSAVGNGGLLKDPRKITDRAFKDMAIRQLIEWLLENKYPHPISPKILHTPSTSDFKRIFEHLNSLTDAQRIGAKIEEEIPKLFKLYGYPFQITKSTMYTVGTPHTWPVLLAALHWFKDQLQYASVTNIEDVLFTARDESREFDTITQEKLLYEFVEKTYMDYMNGQDDFDVHEEQFAKELKKNFYESDEIESKLAENRRLSQELQALKEQPDQLNNLKDRFSTMRLDNERIENYSKELHAQDQHLVMTEKNLETEIAATGSECQSLKNDIQKKQHIQETQEFSQQDVQRINMERQQLMRQTAAVEKEIEGLDKNIWDEEMEHGKYQEKVEQKCAEYNKMAQMLQLIPSTAANAYGVDYEMKSTVVGTGQDQFVTAVKPALTRINSQCMEKENELQEQKFNEQETLDQVTEMVTDKEGTLSDMENHAKHLDENLETLKGQFGRECQCLQNDIDSVQEDLRVLRKQSGMTKADADKALAQEKMKCDRCRKECHAQEKEYVEFIQNACRLVVEHKTNITEHAMKVEQKFQKRLQSAEKN